MSPHSHRFSFLLEGVRSPSDKKGELVQPQLFRATPRSSHTYATWKTPPHRHHSTVQYLCTHLHRSRYRIPLLINYTNNLLSAYSACLAVEWRRWVDLFIQPCTDPEWILTASGLLYIYGRNPVPGPLSSPLFPYSYFPPPPPLPMAVGRLLPSVQV